MSDEKLIHENARLRERVTFLEDWIQREVQGGILHTRKAQEKKESRKRFTNLLEEDNVILLRQHVLATFGQDIEKKSPPYTLERLIDAEIHYKTLQSHPYMDGFAIVSLYQKILDDWLEKAIVSQFRAYYARENNTFLIQSKLDEDIKKVFEKKYRLSLGRFYQVLLQNGRISTDTYTKKFILFLHNTIHGGGFLFSHDFLSHFGDVITSEIFAEKRHTRKVSYADCNTIRKFMKIFFESMSL